MIDPEHRTHFEFCENGAKAVADEATKSRVGAEFFSKYSIQDLANRSDYWLNNQGRITEPMFLDKNSNNYSPISWDDALSKISNKLNTLSSPNKAVFYTSGRTSNEAAFLYQAFIRSFGTNNLPDCSNMCHESSGKGLGSTIGIGKGTVRLNDFNHSDLILVIGQNPGTNHPRMLTALRDAKKKGSKIIHVNPLPEAGLERFKHPQDYMKLDFKSTKLSDYHLQVKIGGDAALIKGLIKVHIELGGLDLDFINNSTTGFQSMCENARNTPWERIGKALKEDIDISKSQLLLSGRCGWDIVAKASRCGVPNIVSIGACSSLAAKAARYTGVRLISFLKPDNAVIIGHN